MEASDDDVIFTLAATHYLVNGTLGSSPEHMMAARFFFETSTSFIIICNSALPPGWESKVDENSRPPIVSDANGRSLSISPSVWLTVRFF